MHWIIIINHTNTVNFRQVWKVWSKSLAKVKHKVVHWLWHPWFSGIFPTACQLHPSWRHTKFQKPHNYFLSPSNHNGPKRRRRRKKDIIEITTVLRRRCVIVWVVLKSICSNIQPCAPEDGHNGAQNMLS